VSSPNLGSCPDFDYCQTITDLWTRRAFSHGDGCVVYNCCWPSPAKSFSYSNSVGLIVFYRLKFETPPTPSPQRTGRPSLTTGTGFPFLRFLRLESLQWRCSNSPPRVPHRIQDVLKRANHLRSCDTTRAE
jgi:hypothetical protein